jgi:CheY-like chemotaxis protein
MYLRGKTRKVLVVDDIKKWRDLACSILSEREDLQVTGQASDGINAVELAKKLQPDLVILDIGLPVLNGFEAARKIHEYSPASLIIFLSAHKSQEMVFAALDLGVNAFVAKTDVQQLLQAIEEVLAGRRFISRCAENPITVPHELEVFGDDESLLYSLVNYVKRALDAQSTAIVMASAEHLVGMRGRLRLEGVDISDSIRRGNYIQVDVHDLLSSFMTDGRPDSVRFEQISGGLIREAIKRNKGEVAVCGECAPILWSEGKFQAAIDIERLWDRLARMYPVHTLCGYTQDHGVDLEKHPSFPRICSHHTAVRGLNSQTGQQS